MGGRGTVMAIVTGCPPPPPRGRVGGVVGGFWSTRRTRPYFYLICSHSSCYVLCFACTRKQVTVQEAYVAGQKVMGRASRKLGKLLPGSPEDLRFRAFFGVSTQVAVTAWSLMEDHNVLPPNPKFVHFLWTLAFNIPQTIPLSHVCWEGATPRR